MATYSAITSAQIDAESPVDTTLAGQWSENLIAVIEGDASSPGIHPSSALDDTITSEGTQSVSGSSTYTPAQGFYNFASTGNRGLTHSIYVSSAWRATTLLSVAMPCTGFFDGTNMRVTNLDTSALTFAYQRLDG